MRRAFLYAGVKMGILTKNMTYQYRKNLSTADRENQLPVISRNDLYKLNWLRSVYKKLSLTISFKEPVDTCNPDLKKTTSEVATSLFVGVRDFRCVPYQFTGQTAVRPRQPSYITTGTDNIPVKSRGGSPGLPRPRRQVLT